LLLLFHPCELDLNQVLFLVVSRLKRFAVLLPRHQLQLVLELLLANLRHLVQSFILLRHLDVDVFHLIFSCVVNSFNLLFVLIDSLVLLLLIPLLQGLDLVL